MSRQRRRHVWVAGLRGLRIFRRHHLSLLSLAVLAVVLTLALTNSGFEVESSSTAPAEAANNTSSPSNDVLPAEAATDRVEVYYIVDSVGQIDRLKAARRNDAIYLSQQSLAPPPSVDIYFLLFDSPETEAIGSHFLSQLAESAPYEGFRLEIVDLTR